MLIQTYTRCGAALLLATLVSGCSMVGLDGADGSGSHGVLNQCSWSRSSCMYEGAYEPGERDYAELEARRLNQAQLERMQRNAGR